MSRLKEIFEGLKFMTKDMPISPECILDNSVKIFISENIDKSKKENIKQIQDKPNNAKLPDTKPTEAQIYTLKKIGKYNPTITKQQAIGIIKQSKENY